MRITTLAEYGTICAVHLAQHATERAVSGRDLAAAEQLPPDYVEQILLRMRRAGIVRSTRGAHGGYQLARAATEISVRDIIEASEETVFELNCTSRPIATDRCASSHACSIRPVWMLLQQKIDAVLSGVLLSDLLAIEGDVRRTVGLPPLPSESDAAPDALRRMLPVLAG